MKVCENHKKTLINTRISTITRLNNQHSIDFPFFLKGLLLVITLINRHASKFLTLYLFYIFIHLYHGAILERLAKSKKVNK